MVHIVTTLFKGSKYQIPWLNALNGGYRVSENVELSCSQTVFCKVGQRNMGFSWSTENVTWHSDRFPFSRILDTSVNMWLVRFPQQWRFTFWSLYLWYSLFWELRNLVLKVPAFTYSDSFQYSGLLSANMCEFRSLISAIKQRVCS